MLEQCSSTAGSGHCFIFHLCWNERHKHLSQLYRSNQLYIKLIQTDVILYCHTLISCANECLCWCPSVAVPEVLITFTVEILCSPVLRGNVRVADMCADLLVAEEGT